MTSSPPAVHNDGLAVAVDRGADVAELDPAASLALISVFSTWRLAAPPMWKVAHGECVPARRRTGRR
jgi:hypothetical protein